MSEPKTAAKWFIPDRPIADDSADEFSHSTVASLLADAVRESDGPRTIGLLGRFGTGKTSVVNLATAMLAERSNYDVVHVTADRHSGVARSRNIVHSIAAEMQHRELLTEHEVRGVLQELRSTVSLAGPAPEEIRLVRLWFDRKSESLRDVWVTLGVGIALFLLFVLLSVVTGNRTGPLFESLGITALVLALGKVGYDHIVSSLFEVPTRTASKSRAEAADDVENVFANLVLKHQKKRKGRPLAIFVDDIDRLGSADVLDAMRAIKSLQAVPRRKEPTFVVSCDEAIVLSALVDAAETSDEAEAIDAGAGIASGPTETNATARAYLEKFFSLRIEMPPHVEDDMPRFVARLVPESHPLRTQLAPETLNAVLLVLARGEVRNARHLIRRVNAFLAAYRLATDREKPTPRSRLHPGDATTRPVLLARLAVLSCDFGWFYDRLLKDEGLLRACDRLARSDELSTVDIDLLERHGMLRDPSPPAPATEAAQPGPSGSPATTLDRWRPGLESLRAFLVASYPSVEKNPASIVPLLYLAQPESGRVLGNERVGALVAAVRNGDVVRVDQALADLPDEHRSIAAAEISRTLSALTPAERPAALSGAVAATSRLAGHAERVAESAALLLADVGSSALEPSEYLQLLRTVPESHRNAVLRLLAQRPEDTTDAQHDDRMLAALEYLAEVPNAAHLSEAAALHLDTIHETSGWDRAIEWIERAGPLDRHVHESLLFDHLVLAMFRLGTDDPSIEYDASAAGLVDLVAAMPSDRRRQLGDVVSGFNPKSDGAAQLLIETFKAGHDPTHVNETLRLRQALEYSPPALIISEGVKQLARSTQLWADATFVRGEDEEEDAPPRYCADTIGDTLATVLSKADVGVIRTFTEVADQLRGSPRAMARLAEASAQRAADADKNSPLPSEFVDWIIELMRDPAAFEDELDDIINRILQPFSTLGDLTDKGRSLLPVIGAAARSEPGLAAIRAQAESWRTLIVKNSAPFVRDPQVAAFQELAGITPDLAGELVDAAYPSVEQRINQGTEILQNLRLLGALPWHGQLSSALSRVENHLDALESVADVTYLTQWAVRAEAEVPASLISRLVEAAETDPARFVPLASAVWGVFDLKQRVRILSAGAGRSDTATELIRDLDRPDLESLLVGAARRNSLEAVLSVARPATIKEAAVGTITRLIEDHETLSAEDTALLIGRLDSVAALVETAAALVAGSAAQAKAALLTLTRIPEADIDSIMPTVDNGAAAHIAEWNVATAETLAELRSNRPLPPALQEVLDDMASSDNGDDREIALRLLPKRTRRGKRDR